MPIVRADGYDRAAALAETLVPAGAAGLEISLTTPFALEAVTTLTTLTTLTLELGDDAVVGTGTVLDVEAARAAVDAGARFLVSPSLEPEVIRTGHRYGVPVFPGVATPTEMLRVLELGADALELFPASGHSPRRPADVRAGRRLPPAHGCPAFLPAPALPPCRPRKYRTRRTGRTAREGPVGATSPIGPTPGRRYGS